MDLHRLLVKFKEQKNSLFTNNMSHFQFLTQVLFFYLWKYKEYALKCYNWEIAANIVCIQLKPKHHFCDHKIN